MSTPAPLVVPEDAEGRPFADAWRRIVEVTTLYVPCPAPLAGQALLDVPEALHHAGTIHLALGRFPELEALMRRTLALRPSPVSRRNLCLALHAQGKLDQARGVYEFLAVHFAEEAERLHKYFR